MYIISLLCCLFFDICCRCASGLANIILVIDLQNTLENKTIKNIYQSRHKTTHLVVISPICVVHFALLFFQLVLDYHLIVKILIIWFSWKSLLIVQTLYCILCEAKYFAVLVNISQKKLNLITSQLVKFRYNCQSCFDWRVKLEKRLKENTEELGTE